MKSRPGNVEPEAPAGASREPFLSRWSRRKDEAKREAQEPPAQKAPDPQLPAPALPPLEKLTLESDYRGFFHPKVSEDVRRAALKKLFSDPHFNVMDGLDVYIDDYSKSEPIPAAMLASLKQAQRILEWAREDEVTRAKEAAQAASGQALAAPSNEAPPGADSQPESAAPIPVSPDKSATNT